MTTRVSLLGATGYGGAELLRHLLFHPEIDVVRVCAGRGARVRLGGKMPKTVRLRKCARFH